MSVGDTHFCVGKVDLGLIQLCQLRPQGLVLIKAGLSEHNPVIKNCSAAGGSRVEPLELVLWAVLDAQDSVWRAQNAQDTV